MFAVIAFMEADVLKSNEILSRPGMSELEEAQISTITDAEQAWRNTGDNKKAKAFLKLSQEKLKNIDNGNEKTVLGMLEAKSEDAIGERRPQAPSLIELDCKNPLPKNMPQQQRTSIKPIQPDEFWISNACK